MIIECKEWHMAPQGIHTAFPTFWSPMATRLDICYWVYNIANQNVPCHSNTIKVALIVMEFIEGKSILAPKIIYLMIVGLVKYFDKFMLPHRYTFSWHSNIYKMLNDDERYKGIKISFPNWLYFYFLYANALSSDLLSCVFINKL